MVPRGAYVRFLKKVKDSLFQFWRTVIPVLLPLFFLGIMSFDVLTFLKNMFCVSWSYCGNWWFLQTYILYLLLYPLTSFLLRGKVSAIVLLILSMTLFRFLSTHTSFAPAFLFLYYFPFFIFGAVFAKFNLFERLSSQGKSTLRLIIYGSFVLVFTVLRMITGYSELLFIIIPLFMLLFTQKPFPSNVIVRSLILLGKYSMGIWLVHGFFIKQIPLQQVTDNCILHFIMIFGASLLVTIVVEKVTMMLKTT